MFFLHLSNVKELGCLVALMECLVVLLEYKLTIISTWLLSIHLRTTLLKSYNSQLTYVLWLKFKVPLRCCLMTCIA